jgi:predicted Zn finger-like uncharacterized protein
MILTCSSCSKRYLVDPRALGSAGRNVRCANCGQTWFQAPPPDAPQSFDAALAAAPEPAIDEPARRRERRVQLPAVSRRRSRGPVLAWLAAFVAVVAIAWGLIAARASVVGLWPPAARLYAMIGYGATVPGTGLELRNVTPSRGVANGVPTLAVDGEVVNVSSVVRPVPELRVALRDSNDKELKAWTVSVGQQTLLPGASVSFHTTIERPAEAATGVIVSFEGAAK